MCASVDLFFFVCFFCSYVYNLLMLKWCVVYVCDCEFDDFVGLGFCVSVCFYPVFCLCELHTTGGCYQTHASPVQQKKKKKVYK